MIKSLTGSIVALITPMLANGSIDYTSLKRLVEFHIKNTTTAIVAVGTTGESATLNIGEHLEVVKKVIEFARGRIPIIAGTGANSTAEAIELSIAAKGLGADYALLVTPYYNKPNQEGLYKHYRLIANSTDIPQILYNVPGRTGVNLDVETVVRLSKIDNIIGLKDATGNLNIAEQLVRKCPKDFMLYSGDDETALSFIALGGNGGISVTANVAPKKVQDIYQTALVGDLTTARSLDNEIAQLHRDLFVESNPIPVKWALYKMGMCTDAIRLPMTALDTNYRDQLEQTLKNTKCL